MDDINFSKDTDLLNSTYCSNDSTNLSTIYNYHKTYTELCLKYNRNLNKVFWQNDYYLSSQSAYNNYHKSIYIINHISVNLNKLILDIYIIEDNYFISEDYILNILGDTYIQNYLTRVYNINCYFTNLYISSHNFKELIWKTYDSKNYAYFCSKDGLNRYKNIFNFNFINYKTNIQRINELEIINENKIKDLEKEIIKLQNKEFSDNNLLLEKDTELYKLKQKFEELEIDYKNIRQKNNDTQQMLDKKKSGIYKLQNKVKEQDKQLKEIEELLEDNLHTHFQELTESELNYKKLESEFNNLYSEKINLQELYNIQENIIISKVEKLELKDNKITYLQENMNMQLEDKDYISENKLLKNQINDQEEIIKQLLDRLEILDREKNKNMLGNVLSNVLSNIFN